MDSFSTTSSADALGVGDLGGELALGLGGERLVDQALRVLDGGGHADADEGLALKALRLDVLVGGDDDGLAGLDLCGRHLVLRADLALGLHLDGEALGSGGLLQGLLGHVRVGDARRATRHGQKVIGGLLVCHTRSFLPLPDAPWRRISLEASTRYTHILHANTIYAYYAAIERRKAKESERKSWFL